MILCVYRRPQSRKVGSPEAQGGAIVKRPPTSARLTQSDQQTSDTQMWNKVQTPLAHAASLCPNSVRKQAEAVLGTVYTEGRLADPTQKVFEASCKPPRQPKVLHNWKSQTLNPKTAAPTLTPKALSLNPTSLKLVFWFQCALNPKPLRP